MRSDTIAAISTAMNDAGIGIIRISGEDAFWWRTECTAQSRIRKSFSLMPTHTIHYGYIWDGEEAVDEVLVMLMRAPRSFTAEDTVEINCHGGIVAMKKILETVIKNGARPAQPGSLPRGHF